MKILKSKSWLSISQEWGLIIFRIIIGWHFLFEGIVKVKDPGWTAEGFLTNSNGFLSGIFMAIASEPALLAVVDFMNSWGLIFIGLGLLLGIFARMAVYAGILLLFLYYIAYIPFQGFSFGVPQEGHYLLVNKTFIELV
jgi:thiosulfate dehydrogenase (quinone) large subunit